jgi:3-carboxy-cis,cis-muconate cycloisomerase
VVLGLRSTPITWHTRRGRIVAAGAWLAELLGALGKMANDVADLASTEVGEVAEPYVPGRGGSSAMPHKRNPISATVILAAHAACAGHVTTLIAASAPLHERPPGLWHAEWTALPQLFGLASGALREARLLAEGLEVDVARMRSNIDLTRGLLFADSVAARLAPSLGREKAHGLIEAAAAVVRANNTSLREVLRNDTTIAAAGAQDAVDAAFDLAPAISAAAAWVDRVVADVQDVRDQERRDSASRQQRGR